ncbi:MAG TPA: ComEC/Rec2 family competence protein [Candidatus Limnocylindria bacterium]|nr:ComEC/Rec2 family competence protein [Candidatus Limnocylindria bacterium]
MSVLLATPLVPAACAAAIVALAFLGGGVPGSLIAVALLAVTTPLAVASVGPRRVVWSACVAAIAAVAAHALLPVALIPPGAIALEVPRAALARPLEVLVPSPESAVLLGIVLGERSGVPADLSLAFARSGTTHLLAISGFNMTLVAAAVSIALRRRATPTLRALVAVGAIALYSLLVGLSPSVLRASLMSTVAAFGVLSGRRAATANALCAALVLMLAADPSAIDDIGLQLSALATAGLVLFQERVASRLAFLPAPVREGVATTLAATIPTLPVIAGAFGRLSLVSVIANLVCVPLFPLLMLAGAATAAAGAVSLDVARPVAMLAWASAFALRVFVQAFASLPLAAIDLPPGPQSAAAVAAGEVVALVALRRAHPRALRLPRARSLALPIRGPSWRRGPRIAHVLVVVLASVPAVYLGLSPASAAAARVTALDVGQGDAYLVETSDATLLVDGGPDPARVRDELGATLGPWRRRIDVVALTHAHTDHGAGLLAVLDRYEVGLAIEPQGLNASPLTELWSSGVAAHGIPRRAVRAGDRIQLGDTRITVLAPDPDLRVDVPSLVLRVERGAFSALFTGDAVDDALARLLDRPEALRARVYVPPHHGAETPYASALRAAAHAEAALISVGAGNRYGHPTPATLAALAGIPTYRTDQDGSVEIALDGTGLVVRTHANGLPPPRRGPLPYPAARQ